MVWHSCCIVREDFPNEACAAFCRLMQMGDRVIMQKGDRVMRKHLISLMAAAAVSVAVAAQAGELRIGYTQMLLLDLDWMAGRRDRLIPEICFELRVSHAQRMKRAAALLGFRHEQQ